MYNTPNKKENGRTKKRNIDKYFICSRAKFTLLIKIRHQIIQKKLSEFMDEYVYMDFSDELKYTFFILKCVKIGRNREPKRK